MENTGILEIDRGLFGRDQWYDDLPLLVQGMLIPRL